MCQDYGQSGRIGETLILKKPGRTRKQGTEWMYKCPVCGEGSKNKFPFEINIVTGKSSCLRCGYTLPKEEKARLLREIKRTKLFPFLLPESEVTDEPGIVGEVPKYLYRTMEERGFDPAWLLHRYKVKWDGSRLCFPVGEGDTYWRRAVYPGQRPKVRIDKGTGQYLLGEHLLGSRDYVVLCEGDYGAASIPLPWIGCALGGTTINGKQVEALQWHKPKLVYVMLDGGVDPSKVVREVARELMDVVSIEELPAGMGPDDLSMVERIKLLEDAVEWE